MAVARKTNGRTTVRPLDDLAMFLNEAYFDFFCVLLCFTTGGKATGAAKILTKDEARRIAAHKVSRAKHSEARF
jgi:hypothetical protein